jgi:hypothetical protein
MVLGNTHWPDYIILIFLQMHEEWGTMKNGDAGKTSKLTKESVDVA